MVPSVAGDMLAAVVISACASDAAPVGRRSFALIGGHRLARSQRRGYASALGLRVGGGSPSARRGRPEDHLGRARFCSSVIGHRPQGRSDVVLGQRHRRARGSRRSGMRAESRGGSTGGRIVSRRLAAAPLPRRTPARVVRGTWVTVSGLARRAANTTQAGHRAVEMSGAGLQ